MKGAHLTAKWAAEEQAENDRTVAGVAHWRDLLGTLGPHAAACVARCAAEAAAEQEEIRVVGYARRPMFSTSYGRVRLGILLGLLPYLPALAEGGDPDLGEEAIAAQAAKAGPDSFSAMVLVPSFPRHRARKARELAERASERSRRRDAWGDGADDTHGGGTPSW